MYVHLCQYTHTTHVQLSAVAMDIGTAINVIVARTGQELYVKVSLRSALDFNIPIHTFMSELVLCH